LPGRNYTNETVGLRADGTLWRWLYFSSTNAGFRRQTDPVQLGADRDWKAIAGGGDHFLALKNDGSLWAWGRNDKGQLGDGSTKDRELPARVGPETGWVQAKVGWGTSLALRTDGSLWEWGEVAPAGSLLQAGSPSQPVCPFPRRVDQGTNWARAEATSANGSVGIQTDGSLWSWGWYGRGAVDTRMPVVQGPTRVGSDRNWAQVTGRFGDAVGLKKDGSLWTSGEWLLTANSGRGEPFIRRSKRGPWLAAGILGSDSGVALAGDGSLWVWGHPFEEESADEKILHKLIPPSTRPQRIATLAGAEPR
jgi:alpha-tubulin suppressor-like RCC1 family protein